MAVYKRYQGKRITRAHPAWDSASWWMEFTLRGQYVRSEWFSSRRACTGLMARHIRKSQKEGRRAKGEPRQKPVPSRLPVTRHGIVRGGSSVNSASLARLHAVKCQQQ
jgi:hypothetical protein